MSDSDWKGVDEVDDSVCLISMVSLRSEQLERGGLDLSSLDWEQLLSSVTKSCSSEVGRCMLVLLSLN